jgi:hypothetical protein
LATGELWSSWTLAGNILLGLETLWLLRICAGLWKI